MEFFYRTKFKMALESRGWSCFRPTYYLVLDNKTNFKTNLFILDQFIILF